MNLANLTKGAIVATAAILIGYDIFVVIKGGPGDTISEVMLAWASSHPILAFAMGALMGHLFWPQRGSPP